MPHLTDTIVAVSSPPGIAPRGIIRISGPQTAAILRQLIDSIELPPRHLTRVTLQSPPIPTYCAIFWGPRSYTGEDIAELQLPGNPALLERVLHQALAAGARLAEPGEFTFRAFLNHRLDLLQAEGVAATIAAVSDAQLHAATMLREGQLGRLAVALADHLAHALALVEAGIDFTDQEDVVPIGPAALDQGLATILGDLAALLARARPWKAIESLPWVVLVGAPSTGKSTLFNALLSRTRAVVSPIPGTTRDILAEPLQLPGPHNQPIEVMLVDIAGLDAPAAALDAQVQAAARDAIARADLVLQINDPVATHSAPTLHIRTMIDLGSPDTIDPRDHIAVSAITGQGLDELRHLIAHHIGSRGVSLAADLLALQPRHESALHAAADHLRHARSLLAEHLTSPHLPQAEQIAAALRAALDALASLAGHISPDDIIGRIFTTFCVGK